MKNELIKPSRLEKSADRRIFLKIGSLSVAAPGLLMIGCNDDEQIPMNPAVRLGFGDIGILYYAYVLGRFRFTQWRQDMLRW